MKFNKSIIVIGDLGHLKVYRVVDVVEESGHETSEVSHMKHHGIQKESITLESITDIDYIEPRKKENELKSDQMGRFAAGSGASTGEKHNMKLEQDKQTLKAISEDIKTIIERESPPSWYLAFSKDTCNELESILDSGIKKTLEKVVPQNLTKIAKDKVLSHFE